MKPKEEIEPVTRIERNTIDRRSLMGLAAAGLAGSLVGCRTESPQRNTSATSRRRRFEGKVVLITGATSGIGRAAAIQFAAESARVSFCGRREKLGHEVEGEIRSSGGEAAYIRADVRNESEVRALVDKTVATQTELESALQHAEHSDSCCFIEVVMERMDAPASLVGSARSTPSRTTALDMLPGNSQRPD